MIYSLLWSVSSSKTIGWGRRGGGGGGGGVRPSPPPSLILQKCVLYRSIWLESQQAYVAISVTEVSDVDVDSTLAVLMLIL